MCLRRRPRPSSDLSLAQWTFFVILAASAEPWTFAAVAAVHFLVSYHPTLQALSFFSSVSQPVLHGVYLAFCLACVRRSWRPLGEIHRGLEIWAIVLNQPENYLEWELELERKMTYLCWKLGRFAIGHSYDTRVFTRIWGPFLEFHGSVVTIVGHLWVNCRLIWTIKRQSKGSRRLWVSQIVPCSFVDSKRALNCFKNWNTLKVWVHFKR